MQPLPLSTGALRLQARLNDAEVKTPGGQVLHVASIGSSFYFAYERLRNAAEYREHHLLLRSAIERFLAHNARLSHYEAIATELVTELTQAGYLKNDSTSLAVVSQVDKLIEEYSDRYAAIRTAKLPGRNKAAGWIYQILSVQIENMLSPEPRGPVFMQFAYEHYYHAIDRSAVGAGNTSDQHYRISLFCAVQRSLFKSDVATARYYCVTTSLPELTSQPIEHFVELNNLIDELYQSPLTNRITRLINRYGAPLRILRELVLEGESFPGLLSKRSEALSSVRAMCAQQYEAMRKSLNHRIVKTIFFIFLTKTIVGIAIEVPYDLLVQGTVALRPLIINILFPVLYMATIGARIPLPTRHNTDVVVGYVDRILYDGAGAPVTYKAKRRVNKKSLTGAFSVVYAAGFLGSIALLVYVLNQLEFNIVNGMIFFLFFSAVSFLGFRIRQSARELEMIDEHQGLLQTVADFLSTPFVRVGHWLSDKYAKANFVTLVLDLAIEMPLKTSLRLIQQWVSFLRDKQEEL